MSATDKRRRCFQRGRIALQGRTALHIQVPDIQSIVLDELPARLHFLAH